LIPALFALLLAPLLASPFNLDGTVLAEGRAGSSPVIAGKAPETFVAGILTPQFQAWLHDETLDGRLTYLPRFMWQTPNNAGYEARPLILHQMSLGLTGRPSSTTDVTARGFGSYGQADYSILPQLIGTAQGALPPVQKIVTASGNVGVQESVSRRLRLTLAGEVMYFRVLGDAPTQNATAMAPALPRQSAFDATPGAIYAVTRNDDIWLTATALYGRYANQVGIESITPLLTWRGRKQSGDELRLSLGVSYARDVGANSIINGGSALLPTATGEIQHSLLVQDAYGLSAHLRLAAEQYVDPILLTTGPRFLASGQLTLTEAPGWSVALQGDFSASTATVTLTPPVLPPAGAAPVAPNLPRGPDQTAFSVRVPVRRRFSRNCWLEVGGFYGDRGPSLTAPNFQFHQRQLWAYFGLTITTQDVGPLSLR
jgi:hypothetical protein